MHIERHYTVAGEDFLAPAAFRIHTGDDGQEYIVPKSWGSAAIEVLLDRAFYKGAIPLSLRRLRDPAVPQIFWPSVAEEEPAFGREGDIRDVLHRIAGSLAFNAARAGLFDGPEDAETFYDELRYILFHQIAALEPALWLSGVNWAYGLETVKYIPAERIAGLPQDFSRRVLPFSAVTISKDEPRRDILKRIRLLAGIDALDHHSGSITVTLPVEHADSLGFMTEKKKEDIDAVARAIGVTFLKQAMEHVMDATQRDAILGFDPAYNPRLQRAMQEARSSGAPEGALQRALELARQGFENVDLGAGEDADGAPFVVPVLSVPDDFIETALTGHGFMMVDGGRASYHAPAPELMATMTDAVWSSGAPEIFFRDTACATFPGMKNVGRSGAGGFVFQPETEAPSATIHIVPFMKSAPDTIDTGAFTSAVEIMTIALEASIASPYLSERTHRWRPLCLGLAGLPSLLMGAGLAYDSTEGRTMATTIIAALTGAAALASARMADSAGAFDRYAGVAKDYLSAVKAQMALLSGSASNTAGLSRRPLGYNPALCTDARLAKAAKELWDRAYAIGKEQGFRHAHITALATDIETQALLSAQTRNVMPESSVVRFEGYFADTNGEAALYGKKMNPMVPQALKRLGYSPSQIDDIHAYAVGHGTLLDAPVINHASLLAKGFSPDALQRLDAALQNAQHLTYVFNEWTLGEGAQSLEDLGFTIDDIDQANLYACGAMTLEGGPHLKPNHLAVFDCGTASGTDAVRFVSAEAQLKLQGAVEPFLSGAVSHTVPLPHHTGMEEVQKLILSGWEWGLKSLKLYREASSLQHPLAIPELMSASPSLEPAADDIPEIQPKKTAKSLS